MQQKIMRNLFMRIKRRIEIEIILQSIYQILYFMFQNQTKTEAKARHVSLLKQKINLIPSSGDVTNPDFYNKVRIKKKLLTQIAEAQTTYNLSTKKLISIKSFQKNKQQKSKKQNNKTFYNPLISHKNFWQSKQKFYLFSKTKTTNLSPRYLQKCQQKFVERGQKLSDYQRGRTNWTRVMSRSQRIQTCNIMKRIRNFENSTHIIQSTIQKLKNEQQKMVQTAFKQLGFKYLIQNASN